MKEILQDYSQKILDFIGIPSNRAIFIWNGRTSLFSLFQITSYAQNQHFITLV